MLNCLDITPERCVRCSQCDCGIAGLTCNSTKYSVGYSSSTCGLDAGSYVLELLVEMFLLLSHNMQLYCCRCFQPSIQPCSHCYKSILSVAIWLELYEKELAHNKGLVMRVIHFYTWPWYLVKWVANIPDDEERASGWLRWACWTEQGLSPSVLELCLCPRL